MKEITFPIRELFTRPADAFARLKAAPPLPAMLLIYMAVMFVGYFFSAQFNSFDSLKTITPYLEKMNIHLSHTTLFIISSGFTLATLLIGAAIIHGVARVVGGNGSFKILLTCILFINGIGMAIQYLFFAGSFARLFFPPLYYIRYLAFVVALWEVAMGMICLMVLYEVPGKRAVFSYLVSELIKYILIVVVVGGALTGFFMKKMPEKLEGMLGAPQLEPVQIPAGTSEWTVQSLDGKTFKLGEAKGKVVFLNFWATWCMPCVAEMPSIQAAYEKLKDKNIVFICVSDEKEETVRKFQEKYKFTFPFYIMTGDQPQVFAARKAIPATFIISPNGQTALKHVGAAKWDSPETIQTILNLLKK